MTTGVSSGVTPSSRTSASAAAVLVEVDEAVGQAVARGELEQATGLGLEAGAEDPQPRADLDQEGAADEERPQDDVAERGVLA